MVRDPGHLHHNGPWSSFLNVLFQIHLYYVLKPYHGTWSKIFARFCYSICLLCIRSVTLSSLRLSVDTDWTPDWAFPSIAKLYFTNLIVQVQRTINDVPVVTWRNKKSQLQIYYLRVPDHFLTCCLSFVMHTHIETVKHGAEWQNWWNVSDGLLNLTNLFLQTAEYLCSSNNTAPCYFQILLLSPGFFQGVVQIWYALIAYQIYIHVRL